MKLLLRATGVRLDQRSSPTPSSDSASLLDPRAARYFAMAARYNAAAEELGYLSLEHAVRAGRMTDILRCAGAECAVRSDFEASSCVGGG